MGHGKDLVSVRREWFPWLLLIELLVAVLTLQVAMGDEIGIPPTGLLCISNCATCPAICPPPEAFSLPPPPPLLPSLVPPLPPLPSSVPPPPLLPSSVPPPLPSSPPPHYSYSPPQLFYFPPSSPPPPPPSPPHSPASYSSPPPSYSSLSSSPPPSYSFLLSPPPPPPSTYLNTPSAPLLPIIGPQNSSNPYNYYYASKAASLSLPAPFSCFFISLLFLSLVVPFW